MDSFQKANSTRDLLTRQTRSPGAGLTFFLRLARLVDAQEHHKQPEGDYEREQEGTDA